MEFRQLRSMDCHLEAAQEMVRGSPPIAACSSPKSCNHRSGYVLSVYIATVLVACSPNEKVIEQFRDYRHSVSDKPSESATYFSQAYLADSVGAIIESDFPDTIEVLNAFSDIFEYGRKINKVHEYEVENSSDGEVVLVVYFSTALSSDLHRVDYHYVFENNRFLIDSSTFYLDTFGDAPSRVIDDFSSISESIMIENQDGHGRI